MAGAKKGMKGHTLSYLLSIADNGGEQGAGSVYRLLLRRPPPRGERVN